MRTLSRSVAFASMLVLYSTISIPSSIAQDSKKEPAGSITGRVTLGGKPAPRVTVMLAPANRALQQPPPARATTDEEGHFKLKALPAGSYTVLPHTPALVVAAETSMAQPGKTVTLGDGEEVEGIDFSLVKGGVITGRVTNAEGRPIVEQHVNLIRVDERGQRVSTPYFNQFMFSTDDRGVYRLYGLSPGRYKVSVGDAPDSGMVRIGFGGGAYPRTFHPDVTDESNATAVEVSGGGEATHIDIKLGRASKSYVATGRIIDSDTGKPLANFQYGYGPITPEQRMTGGFGWTGNRTNNIGEFRIEGVSPGRYAAFAVATEQVDFYSEPAVFEISDSDASAIEIKVRRGSSISGVAVIEGSEDADVLARISKLELRSYVQTEDLAAPAMPAIRMNPDGTFRITGLRPGKVRISLNTFGYEAAKGFSLMRVEREGAAQRDGIDVVAGENVSGVRVVIGYGTCVVRGQVRVQGGELTPDTRLRIMARRLESDSMPASTVADARGRFTIEGLLPGEYEITLNPMFVTPSSPGAPPPPSRLPNRKPVKQNVTVANGVETEVTLVLDLAAKDKDGEK
ncbi:MAG: carboxypeptidase-like regulatory domain-containing protein [Acidobacteriota bacterium]